MRPDRIIVGEVRGEEAIDMLQAMNTGHDGGLTTIHANSARDALARLETMIAMANLRISDKAMRQQICSAINLIIQVSRMSDGTRKVMSVSEVVGMEGEIITMQEVYKFTRTGMGLHGEVQGQFRPTGIRPRFSERLEQYGFKLPPQLFEPNF
jgi:pilus assembly protein CpaF